MILILFDSVEDRPVKRAPLLGPNPNDAKVAPDEKINKEDVDVVIIDPKNKKNIEKTGDGKFTLGSAFSKFCKGFFSPLTALYHHPVISVGLLGAGIVGCTLIPALVPVLTVGFGIYSAYQIGKGLVKTTVRLIKGDCDGAENAFEDLGAGTSGLLLGAWGLKSSAAIANQSKVSHIALQEGKTLLLAKLEGQMAYQNTINKNLTLAESLKENVSFLRTKEGVQALFGQFSKTGIRDRGSDLVRNIKNFRLCSNPSELAKRSRQTKAELEPEIRATYKKVLDELDIPEELRPPLVIKDEARYLSEDEIISLVMEEIGYLFKLHNFGKTNPKPIPQLKVFKPGEKPIDFTTEQIIEKAKIATKKALDEYGITVPGNCFDNRFYSLKSSESCAAEYSSNYFEITYKPYSYRTGLSYEEALYHECYHLVRSLLRCRMPAKQYAEIVENEILTGILHGEPKLVPINRYENVQAPTMSVAMREDIVSLLRNNLFRNIEKYTNDTPEDLQAFLKPLLDRYADFQTQNLFKTMEEAEFILGKYIQAQINRFNNYGNVEITNPTVLQKLQNLPLSDEETRKAITAVEEYVACHDGNSLLGEAPDQYIHSIEETMARITSVKYELQILRNKLSGSNKSQRPLLENTIKKSERMLSQDELGLEMELTRQQSLANPTDTALKSLYENQKIQYDAMTRDFESDFFNYCREFTRPKLSLESVPLYRKGESKENKLTPEKNQSPKIGLRVLH